MLQIAYKRLKKRHSIGFTCAYNRWVIHCAFVYITQWLEWAHLGGDSQCGYPTPMRSDGRFLKSRLLRHLGKFPLFYIYPSCSRFYLHILFYLLPLSRSPFYPKPSSTFSVPLVPLAIPPQYPSTLPWCVPSTLHPPILLTLTVSCATSVRHSKWISGTSTLKRLLILYLPKSYTKGSR